MIHAARLLAIIPVVALSATALCSMNMGIAGTTSTEAIGALGEKPASELHATLEHAASLDSSDPSVRELLGLTSEYPSDAAVHFRRALELRPSSPYTWANVAAIDYQLGQTNSEFKTALVRASELGPYEPEVQRTVADFGLAVWDEVDSSVRVAVEDSV